MFSKSIESAQKKVEGNNYDMRKSLLDYDNIVSEQRKIIYNRRNELLDTDDAISITEETFNDYVDAFVEDHIAPEGYLTEKDLTDITNHFNSNILRKNKINIENIQNKKEDEVIDYITSLLKKDFEEKLEDIPKEITENFTKFISLRVIDDAWIEHINAMDHLREGIGLRGYGQTNPLQAYALEGYDIFDKMQDNIDANITNLLMKVEIKQNITPQKKEAIHTNDGKEGLKQTPKVNDKKKIGRNDPCWCGSGKKYKQCHGKQLANPDKIRGKASFSFYQKIAQKLALEPF